MNIFLGNIFSVSNFFYLSGLVMASMLFVTIGVKKVKQCHNEGILYIILAAFFLAANIIFIIIEKSSNIISNFTIQLNLFEWITLLLGPALILIYIGFGLFNFIKSKYGEAALKIVLGVTMICFLYLLGAEWSNWIKAILILIFSAGWFAIELRTVDEMQRVRPKKII